MIDKKRIQEEAEAFFEFPTADKSYVTRTSMLFFAAVIAEMVRNETLEEAAKRIESPHDNYAQVIRSI